MSDERVERAYEYLRAHYGGDLRFDEHFRPIEYVIAPTGRLVAPVMVAMLQTLDTVLFIPAVQEDAMEVQVTLDKFDENGEHGHLADRWRIHHGQPPDVNWAFLDIDAIRFDAHVMDGDTFMRPNPLAADEPRLCKLMNTDHTDRLRRLCLQYADIEIESPKMVGIDPTGIDVRGRFDVVRVPARERIVNAEVAMRILAEMDDARSADADA